MNIIKSPITNEVNATKVYEINTNTVIEKYKTELDLNVEKYFKTKKIEIYECPKTGYRFYHPPSMMADASFYETLNETSNEQYYSERWEHKKALQYINNTDSVLDIGCGSGKFIDLCKINNPSQNVQGLELNTKCVKELKSKNYDVYNATIQEFSTTGKKFDTICTFQVLEHIYDINSFISACLNSLKTDGRLIIGVPNNNPFILKNDIYHTLNLPPHHIGLWNNNSLEKLGEYFNLEVLYNDTEPLKQYKEWFNIQKEYLIKKNKLYTFLKLIPRPLYKLLVKLFSFNIDGMYCLVVFRKK
jgi:2-polyprenyl-3-methyl-5-hydroxy-6-metoxy-1,4-benzoquinol methylase